MKRPTRIRSGTNHSSVYGMASILSLTGVAYAYDKHGWQFAGVSSASCEHCVGEVSGIPQAQGRTHADRSLPGEQRHEPQTLCPLWFAWVLAAGSCASQVRRYFAPSRAINAWSCSP